MGLIARDCLRLRAAVVNRLKKRKRLKRFVTTFDKLCVCIQSVTHRGHITRFFHNIELLYVS